MELAAVQRHAEGVEAERGQEIDHLRRLLDAPPLDNLDIKEPRR